MMWMEFMSVERQFVAEPPLPRQHFFQFCSVVALGFIGCANTWQAFFQFLEPRIHDCGTAADFVESSAVTILRKLSECARVLAPLLKCNRCKRCEDASQLRIASRHDGQAARNFLKLMSRLRTALNVPCFDGRSPTSGENSTSPVIKSAVSNFPLQHQCPRVAPDVAEQKFHWR